MSASLGNLEWHLHKDIDQLCVDDARSSECYSPTVETDHMT